MSYGRCFNTNDIRGKLGQGVDTELAYRLGRAFAVVTKAKDVVVGGDMRLSSPALKNAICQGLRREGANAIDIGLVGTEEVYFSTFHYGFDGGIMVTASHNPAEYNGMKLVGRGAKPISAENGLNEIAAFCDRSFEDVPMRTQGRYCMLQHRDCYIEHILSTVDLSNIRPLRIVVDPGNGVAGLVLAGIQARFNLAKVPIEFIPIREEPDGHFPNGVPNPLLPENRHVTSHAVVANKADFGIAWDGDFDRCFFFDENGDFVDNYYVVGLLADCFLRKQNGGAVIHDSRLYWNTQHIAGELGGRAVEARVGHAFIKAKMRDEDAIYGGEVSAHHYFRDFGYCDSGMLPWLLVVELLSRLSCPLSKLTMDYAIRFPASDEVNFKVADPAKAIKELAQCYGKDAVNIDYQDGVSLVFSDWRFNVRASNTEPLIRLNLETRGDSSAVSDKVQELSRFLVRYQ
uniref:phosphomannomutase n=1 Tax=Thaumasiovibrio occultus TaxID=1891184 RepID=UPI000B34FC8F|nr:phosphomannomutase [Thaumasiovibrio occultus]